MRPSLDTANSAIPKAAEALEIFSPGDGVPPGQATSCFACNEQRQTGRLDIILSERAISSMVNLFLAGTLKELPFSGTAHHGMDSCAGSADQHVFAAYGTTLENLSLLL